MTPRILLLIALFLFSAAGYAQDADVLLEKEYTMEIAAAPLVEVLGMIRSNTGVRFVYSPSNLPVDQLVMVSAQDRTLREILDATFVPVHINYEVIGGQIALRWNPPEKRIEYTQTIRGQIVDQDTQTPLVGAHVIVSSLEPLQGASTDVDGHFEISGLPVGRHSLIVQYIGFSSLKIPELLLTAGKELVMNIELEALPLTLGNIEVAGTVDPLEPLNEVATVSARSFSVEHTQRYAASLSDPARMAQAFAGVSRSEDDLLNDVSVRGQSPKYTIWMLEGIEIPNPNHFGEEGYSSGGVNMLSANMLTYSDFLTGAFPASYGNALAGVFDVNLRKGNNVRPEHTLHIGVLGLEGSTEGPFSKKYSGSYVVNYRYSTAGLLTRTKILEEDVIGYEDVSFKIHLPTRNAGQFSLFGVGGISTNEDFAARDSAAWGGDPFGVDDGVYERRGIVGMGHTYVLSDNAYLKSTIAGFMEKEREEYFALDPATNYEQVSIDLEESVEGGVRGVSSLNWKRSAQNVFQFGVGASYLRFRYLFREKRQSINAPWFYTINTQSRAVTWRSYAQWMHRPSTALQLHAGVHVSGFSVNKETTVEPRFGLRWQLKDDQYVSLGTGLYSQIEPYGTYIVESEVDGAVFQPNRTLRKSKSWHSVLGYEYQFSPIARLKAEMYYNLGYDMPVGNRPGNSFSVVNSYYLYDIVIRTSGLSNDGKTANYGIDLTLERFFSDGYYAMLTGSVFDSKYTTIDGSRFSSRYDTGYMVNLLGGIERPFSKQKKNLVSVNGRIVWGGGNKYTPINIEASQEAGFGIIQDGARFAAQLEPYFRVDFGFNFTFNKPFLTHTLYFDAQNIFNQKNLADPFYNRVRNEIEINKQTGIIPVLGYRLSF
ncbi:MAG: TonB-dependent receptor [Rhodothermaceae bacterium]|nr:TonB-dependent receptor [Rhodothermaceae bacterium]